MYIVWGRHHCQYRAVNFRPVSKEGTLSCHTTWHGASVFAVSSKGLSNVSRLLRQPKIPKTYSNKIISQWNILAKLSKFVRHTLWFTTWYWINLKLTRRDLFTDLDPWIPSWRPCWLCHQTDSSGASFCRPLPPRRGLKRSRR